MSKFQGLPDELVLKILSYSETKDLISCGQASKRIRRYIVVDSKSCEENCEKWTFRIDTK